jgi:23S rRNA pseudouridine1911/1915/1917 synthase
MQDKYNDVASIDCLCIKISSVIPFTSSAMGLNTYSVTEKHVGKRLDIFIVHYEPHISRSRIQTMIKNGLALVNEEKEKSGYRVKLGDKVTLHMPERVAREVLPEPIPLSVIYEDPHIIVLNKPPGLVVHPAPGNYTGTLVNSLLYHYGSLPSQRSAVKGNDRERAGIVHRLDKDTSGVMVVARTYEALRSLSGQFKNRIVRKKYVALVAGIIKKGTGLIDADLGRHMKERKKISVHTRSPRAAVTSFVVKVDIKTGRTHQIRVHMAHIGHPVLGDHVYGGNKATKTWEGRISRQMLHAESLSFFHPETGHPMTFSVPPPQDMKVIIERLRSANINNKVQ